MQASDAALLREAQLDLHVSLITVLDSWSNDVLICCLHVDLVGRESLVLVLPASSGMRFPHLSTTVTSSEKYTFRPSS